jgi:hypothetical protein
MSSLLDRLPSPSAAPSSASASASAETAASHAPSSAIAEAAGLPGAASSECTSPINLRSPGTTPSTPLAALPRSIRWQLTRADTSSAGPVDTTGIGGERARTPSPNSLSISNSVSASHSISAEPVAQPVSADPVADPGRTGGPDVPDVRRQLRRTQTAGPPTVEAIGYIAIRIGHGSAVARIVIPSRLSVAAVCIAPTSPVHEIVAVVIEEVIVDV